MKKVLISVLLVLLTLCLFVSCSNEPKPTTKTIKLYLDKVEGEPTYTFQLPNVEKWSDLKWRDVYYDDIEGKSYFLFYDPYVKFVDEKGDSHYVLNISTNNKVIKTDPIDESYIIKQKLD